MRALIPDLDARDAALIQRALLRQPRRVNLARLGDRLVVLLCSCGIATLVVLLATGAMH